MKKATATLLLLLATPATAAGRSGHTSLTEVLNGVPTYLGTIAASTSKTNHDTATPFNNTGNALCGKVLLVQNAAAGAVRLLAVATNTGTVSNTRGATFGPSIGAGERVVLFMPPDTRRAAMDIDLTTATPANEAAAMAVVGGTGLQIQPAAGTDWLVATRTIPGLGAALTDLIADLTASMPLRLSAEFTGNFTANWDSIRLGFETLATPTINQFIAGKGLYSGTEGVFGVHVINGTDLNPTAPNATGSPYTTAGALRITLPDGIAGGRAIVEGGASLAALMPATPLTPTKGPIRIAALSDCRMLIGAIRAGSGTSLTVTVTKLKLESLG